LGVKALINWCLIQHFKAKISSVTNVSLWKATNLLKCTISVKYDQTCARASLSMGLCHFCIPWLLKYDHSLWKKRRKTWITNHVLWPSQQWKC